MRPVASSLQTRADGGGGDVGRQRRQAERLGGGHHQPRRKDALDNLHLGRDATRNVVLVDGRGLTMSSVPSAIAGMDYSGAQTNTSVTQESIFYLPTDLARTVVSSLSGSWRLIGPRLEGGATPSRTLHRGMPALYNLFIKRNQSINKGFVFLSSLCGASLYLSLIYICMRRYGKARALLINGCFLHQCFVHNTPIDHIQSHPEPLFGAVRRQGDTGTTAAVPGGILRGGDAPENGTLRQDVPSSRVQAADVIDRQLVGQTTYHELRWTK